MGKDELTVDGYRFNTEEDAELARQEKKKIDYIREHMDIKHPENMLKVYEKAIDDKIFQTPLGWEYLAALKNHLLREGIEEESIPPIPFYQVFAHQIGTDNLPARARVKPAKKKTAYKGRFQISLMINLLLAAAVAAMFAIALKSDNPNILNYRRALTDRYASWEQQLTEREQAVREKERELKLESDR